jgi:putative ABC transport system permease protein
MPTSARFETTVRVALDTLRANPMRTLLSTLGIVMGAASLSAVLSLGDGMERFARETVELEGMQLVSLSPRTGDTIDGVLVPRPDFPTFVLADADELKSRLPGNPGLALMVQGSALATVGGARRGVLGIALTSLGSPMPGLKTVHGRLPSADDARRGEHVAAISESLARAVAGDPVASAVGAALRLGDADCRVVGILESTPQAGRGFRAVVPFPLADQALVRTSTPRAPQLLLNAAGVEEVPAVRKGAEQWIAARGWTDKIEVRARGPERLRQVANGILIFKILMGAFTAISLVVGGIGIMNVLLASVAERTREIGIRKAIGASRRTVVMQFLAESVAISMSGAAIGVVVGLGGAAAVTAVMRAQTEARIYSGVTWQTILVSMAAAALVGLLFGTYPALRAARLSPVDAITRE